MFTKSAAYYDLIYSFKDYQAETSRIRDLLKARRPEARSVLDIACGTGEHARLLAADYQVDGLDLDPGLLELARAKNPGGQFWQADMCEFQLGRRYDVVLCLFSSIGYLTEPERLIAALRRFAAHLEPGGLIAVEPWFTPDAWKSGGPHMLTVDRPELKICRMSMSRREGSRTLLDFQYLIGTPGGVEHCTEEHELRLYGVEEMLGFFRQAGLEVEYDPAGLSGRGLYLAREPETGAAR